MTLTEQSFTALPAAINALGGEQFPVALLDLVRCAADFDSAVIMSYPESGSLNILYNALHEGDQSGFSGPYRNGLWLLSPLYLSAKSGLRGFFHILELAPDNFRDSEYYSLYYQTNGIIDHTIFLLEGGDGTPLAISLERSHKMSAFTGAEKKQLNSMTAILSALLKQHWKSGLNHPTHQDNALHHQVQSVLQQFGTSYLTPRERDVAQLVLKGYPSKLAARELGISAQTEQVHRKNIYQKLGLSSHNELFSLFFDALVQPGDGNTDPLRALLKDSPST
ncbi:MAG: helix-turn-helix transcriptional regulator [Halioglobus sp.]